MENELLEIFIVTYNRVKVLEKTLFALNKSVLRKFKITVLNNNSSDKTKEMCDDYIKRMPNFYCLTHKYNIGSDANILRAFELSQARYTWVMCDDDHLFLDNITDVLNKIVEGVVDIIHVGAHPGDWEYNGYYGKIQDIFKKGYPFFMYGSFLPCSIFKTELFLGQSLVDGYMNIINHYPHMPLLFKCYTNNFNIYISQYRLVEASIGTQSYNDEEWLVWWLNTAKLIKDREMIRIVFISHFNNIASIDLIKYLVKVGKKDMKNKYMIKDFVRNNFNLKERFLYFIMNFKIDK